MEINLDDKAVYQKLDQGKVGESIKVLPKQIKQVLAEQESIKLPTAPREIDKIVLNGMGGSNLGARIIASALKDQLRVPLLIAPGYSLPAYVDNKTLYIISSYSGTTEEPLSTYERAVERGAQVAVLTAQQPANKLAPIALADNLPGFIFAPKFNPSGQPRLGIGYAVAALLLFLDKIKALSGLEDDFSGLADFLAAKNKQWAMATAVAENQAKKTAQALKGRIPVLVAVDFLAGNMHALRNQINESSKNFSLYLTIPELNHYAMEGLKFPEFNPDALVFLFFDSELCHLRLSLRQALTKEVVEKNKIKVISYEAQGKTRLQQAFEILQFGSWLSYYLGLLNNIKPAEVPWVDWFKQELKRFEA